MQVNDKYLRVYEGGCCDDVAAVLNTAHTCTMYSSYSKLWTEAG